MKLPIKFILAVAIGCLLKALPVFAVPGSFTGAYSTNFDGVGPGGTGMPVGFRSMVMAGANTTFAAGTPISAAGIAGATVSANQTLLLWTPGTNAASSSTQIFNSGSWGNPNDRALGTDVTGTAANVIELSLTNNTGTNLPGVVFNYDLKVMTNGNVGTESGELPGYAFFYSITGSTAAADWLRADGLSLTNSTPGTINNSGNITVTFPVALTNKGVMYFRWADDNNQPNSPDQMIAIDNIAITVSANVGPSVSLLSPANGTLVALGTNLALQATAADANGSVTKVEFFAGATRLGQVTSAPYDFTWTNASPLGAISLTARATDNDGATTTSSAAGVTVVPDLGAGGLYFDGVNDYLTFGAATTSLGVSNFTVECWFKRTGAGSTTSTGTGGVTAYPLVTKGRGESDGSNVDCNWFLGFTTSGQLTADFEDFNNGLNHPITGVTPIVSNVWQHAAVTYDMPGGTWVLYLNGVPDATNVISGADLVRTPRYDSIQHAGLATAMTSAGAAAGFFNGRLDEVRVWNYARPAADILSDSQRPVISASGLIGRWALDETNGTIASNTGSSGVNGTLLNGPLWVLGYPFPSGVFIVSPTNNAVFEAPADISLTANAYALSGNFTNVEFFAGITSLGAVSGPPFNLTRSNVAVGSYALTAVGTDTSGLASTSSVVSVSVVAPNLAPVITAILSPTNSETEVVKSPSLGITASDPEGSNLTVTFFGRPVGPAPAPDFTLIALPDTQFYSETFSNVFFAQTDWILANRGALNIPYVAQLGDCVQNGDKGGNDNEWRNATNALYRMENPAVTTLPYGIPYGVAVGNHDQGPTGNGIATDTTTFYNQYFGTNHFLPYNYYGGNFGTNNDNHFDLFSASGMDFIVIYFEYDTTATATNLPVYAWANNLLQTYSSRRAIVVSHWIINSYTAGNTFGAQGQAMYDALKGNTNLFLMLCGHINPNGEGRRLDTFNGRPVWTLLSDYQDLTSGGNGWLRTYTFSPANNVIHAKTYSPWLNQSQTGTNSQFDVSYAMTPANPFATIGVMSNVVSGSGTAVVWKGLKSNTAYEWYATVSDGHSTRTGPISQFTTATNLPLIPPSVTLTAPANGASFLAPASLTLTASAGDTDGLVTNVAFYRGATKLGDVAAAPFNFAWNGATAGNYALTAISSDDDGLMATSSVVSVTVTNSPGAEKLQGIGKIFVIAMENHNFTQPNPTSSPQQIFTNPAAPYINSLITPGHSNAAQVSYARRYFNACVGSHPSEPNYVWAEAGTDFGVHTDNDPTAASGNVFNAPHLTRQLNAAGIAWRNYQEDVQLSASPTNSASGTSGTTINPYYGNGQFNYAVKHNPMAFFTDTQVQNVRALTNFLGDLTNNTIGRYNWITPNQFNDQHSALSGGFTYQGVSYTGDLAAIAQGDNFLATLIPKIMASAAYQSNGVIIIWWDETEGGDTTNFTIPEIVISPLARGNAYASTVELNHSSDIKTMEEILGLSYLSNAIPVSETAAGGVGYNNVATVNDLSDLFRGLNTPPVAHDATFTRAPGLPLKISIPELLATSASDVDSGTPALLGVGGSAHGASISTNGTHIFYNPTNNSADSFSYSVADDRGASASANINVLVVNAGGLARTANASNGVVSIDFAGIPGFQYDIQHSTNLVDWTVSMTLAAPPNGLFQFIETNAPSPSFYRLMQH